MEIRRGYIVLIISSLLFQTSSANTNLNVGVVEFKPADRNEIPSTKDRMSANIQKYIEILNNTNLDLIIYPEDGLNTGIPVREYHDYTTVVKLQDNPCTENNGTYPEFIKRLSCAIRNKGQTYVVINTVEKEKCSNKDNDLNCRLYRFHFYNTDIVFNNEGTIIKRYRKYNLFGEIEINEPKIVDHTIFTLKNETIGVFTCFDIMFKTPPEDLVEKGVKNVAFPTMWFSEIPFLTALQTQQMWSIEHNVNLFAADANNPSRGGGGSGIFYGNLGPVNYDIISSGGTKLLTNSPNDIPKNISNITTEEIDILGQQMDNFSLLVDHLENYTSVILNTTQEFGEYNVCHSFNATESLCCSFKVKISTSNQNATKQYVYHLVAYAGIRTFSGVRDGGVEACGVIACLNTNVSSCGRRFPKYDEISWPITFQSIEISGNYTDNKNRTQYPSTLWSSIRPLHPQHFDWSKKIYSVGNRTIIERSLKLTQPQNRLLTFAIYGRNFELDSSLKRNDSDDSNHSNMLLSSNLYLYIVYIIAACYVVLV